MIIEKNKTSEAIEKIQSHIEIRKLIRAKFASASHAILLKLRTQQIHSTHIRKGPK